MKKGISFLSVIVPAYNEIKTFKILVNKLLKLKFDGIRIEISIWFSPNESNEKISEVIQSYFDWRFKDLMD